jgi:hypothetical protein
MKIEINKFQLIGGTSNKIPLGFYIQKKYSAVYNVEGVYKSDLFERIDNNLKEGYYQWILKK